jgi:hypothetical protein
VTPAWSDPVSALYGYMIAQLDLRVHASIINNLKKQFTSLRESILVRKELSHDDAAAIVFDLLDGMKNSR